MNTFPPGAIESCYSSKENIDKYHELGPVSLAVIRAKTADLAPVDLDPSKLEYKEWVDDRGHRYYSTVLKGTSSP